MATVVDEVKLILVEIDSNNNKFWHGKRYDDNTVYTEWGRVGTAGGQQTKAFDTPDRAEKYFNSKRKEKEAKGYSLQRTLGAAPKMTNAKSLVKVDEDPTTQKLIDYLVKVNIHNITSLTTIQYDIASGSFQTPLGIVTDDGITEAEQILQMMGSYVERQNWSDPAFSRLISDYMRIVPSHMPARRPEPRQLYPDVAAIQNQQSILDALKASLLALSTTDDAEEIKHRAKLTLVRDDNIGKAIFSRVLAKYNDSKNDRHQAARLRLLRVYEIQINGMHAAYENDGAKLDNQWELWHGTRAANLLSMMNAGYVVPRAGGSVAITGRMFGDGVYFSDQSTKSLNYSAGYWGGGKQDKSFMLLNDVAMGKFHVPQRSFSGGCRPGFDSTFAKAGQSGVMNNEIIVYRTSQIRPRYLCEFGS